MLKWKLLLVIGALAVLGAGTARAASFSGIVYYTNFNGGVNVNKIPYSYDDTTHTFSLGVTTGIASANGADGIIFDSKGNLLVGGQGANEVHQYTTGGVLLGDGTIPTNSYHLALDPSGNYVYTSTFGGPLEKVPLTPNIGPGTQTTVSGGDSGVTQVAFAPNGNVFYQDGFPNCCGNVGLINLTTGVTVQLHSGVTPAHGLIYDKYTGLMTMFGAGYTGTMDQLGGNLKTSGQFTCDFDQGAVDGLGHALVAGCGAITLIDYRASGDITNPNYFATIGGFSGIDDVAPLSGLGSNTVPEPSTFVLLGSGLIGLVRYCKSRLG